jgi:hypothetical protein
MSNDGGMNQFLSIQSEDIGLCVTTLQGLSLAEEVSEDRPRKEAVAIEATTFE